MNEIPVVPLVIRGQVFEDHLQTYNARAGGMSFASPDVARHLGALSTGAQTLCDLYALSLEEIVEFMSQVGASLSLETNRHMQQAFAFSSVSSGMSRSILETLYRALPNSFGHEMINRIIDTQIGRDYLEGWVATPLPGGRTLSIRAFGARAVHIIAGNSPGVAFLTVLRSAITRSDSIIKLPSNDPMTASAILRTMIDLEPDHPVTRHLSAGYWKGGDERVEQTLYQPRNVEKIVAWGGFASVTHITKYLQPGIDLITLDPKHSGSIIGPEALANDEAMADVAAKAALDIGAYNQELCANARVIYVICDQHDPAQMAKLDELGRAILAEIGKLPNTISTPAKYANPQLQDELAGIGFQEDFYRLHSAGPSEGAIIVSQYDEPVEFAGLLANRTANLVPVADVGEALRRINAASQTVGVYPDSLRAELRDALAIHGAQHIVSLGKVSQLGSLGPQDGLEVERRMLKWVRDVTVDVQ